MQTIGVGLLMLALAVPAAAQAVRKTGASEPAGARTSESADSAEPLDHPNWLSPFVATPAPVVEAALKLGGVSAADLVYDLGSGDGRIILAAAQRFQARAVGIEWNQQLCEQTTLDVQRLGLAGKVKVIQGDIFAQDLSSATVVTGYLMPKAWGRLGPILEGQLKKGARVVSINDAIPGWQIAETRRLKGEREGFSWILYLYRID